MHRFQHAGVGMVTYDFCTEACVTRLCEGGWPCSRSRRLNIFFSHLAKTTSCSADGRWKWMKNECDLCTYIRPMLYQPYFFCATFVRPMYVYTAVYRFIFILRHRRRPDDCTARRGGVGAGRDEGVDHQRARRTVLHRVRHHRQLEEAQASPGKLEIPMSLSLSLDKERWRCTHSLPHTVQSKHTTLSH